MVLGRPWFLTRLVPQSPRARAPQRHPEGEGVRCEGSASGTLALTNHGRTDMVVGRDIRMVARHVQYGRALVDWASRGTRTRTRTVVYKAGRRITSPSSLHTCNTAPEIYTWSNAAYECRATPQTLTHFCVPSRDSRLARSIPLATEPPHLTRLYGENRDDASDSLAGHSGESTSPTATSAERSTRGD